MIECERCGFEFDGTAFRWLCPGCKQKADCCSGAPLPSGLPSGSLEG